MLKCRVYLCRFVNSLVVGGEVKVAGAARGPAGHNYYTSLVLVG
jgi:hypothetical protein